MKTIIAKDKEHLEALIHEAIEKEGCECDLNFIDVSQITDMSGMFMDSKFNKFNGDISKWDVSNVTNMSWMFSNSSFDGNISKWNVANVTNMSEMFSDSCFNGDISKWELHGHNLKDLGLEK